MHLGAHIGAQRVRYSGEVTGDAFPNLEIFVVRLPFERMLHTFQTEGGQTTGPLVFLPGDFRRDMGTFNRSE